MRHISLWVFIRRTSGHVLGDGVKLLLALRILHITTPGSLFDCVVAATLID